MHIKELHDIYEYEPKDITGHYSFSGTIGGLDSSEYDFKVLKEADGSLSIYATAKRKEIIATVTIR